MNVMEINPGTNGTILKYMATAVSLTILTAWVVTAFQSDTVLPKDSSIFKRALWPIFFLINSMQKMQLRKQKAREPELFSISAYDEEGKALPVHGAQDY